MATAKADTDWSIVRAGAEQSVLLIEVKVSNEYKKELREKSNQATGFIVSKLGHVVTAAHAVPNLEAGEHAEYYASFGALGNAPLKLEYLKHDRNLDIALFQLPDIKSWKSLNISNSEAVSIETELYALGFPSAAGRLSSATGRLSNRVGERGFWQTTLPLNPGISGGPVFGVSGIVVGMAAGGKPNVQLITYVVPSPNLLNFLVGIVSSEFKPNVNHEQSTPVPPSTKTDLNEPITQRIEDVDISLIKTERVGLDLFLHLRFLNRGNVDKKITLFGAGSSGGGTQIYHSNGEVRASQIKVGSESKPYSIHAKFIPNIPIDGYVKFSNIPTSVNRLSLFDFGYSFNNATPSGFVRFPEILLESKENSAEK